MLKIYHAEGRRSERIAWLCEEIGMPYALIFSPGDLMASIDRVRAVNPLMGIVPSVSLDEEILVESGAILQLLHERHGGGALAPAATSPDYPKYLQWFHFAEGSAAPRFITEFLLQRAVDGEPPAIVKNQFGRSDQVLGYLEDFLVGHPYFGGPLFSLADIMMHFNITFISMVAQHDMTPYPATLDWLARVEDRPAFRRMRTRALPNGFIGVPT